MKAEQVLAEQLTMTEEAQKESGASFRTIAVKLLMLRTTFYPND